MCPKFRGRYLCKKLAEEVLKASKRRGHQVTTEAEMGDKATGKGKLAATSS
jgi:hypothetical protein